MSEDSDWLKTRQAHLDRKIVFIEDLIEERKELHERHLKELLEEDCALSTRFLQLQSRQFCLPQDLSTAGNIYSGQSRLADQKRQFELNLWKEIAQFKQAMQDIKDEKSKLYQVNHGR